MAITAGGLAAGSLWLQAAGAGMQAIGAYQQAKSQKSALKHQAAMSEIGADVSMINAQIAQLGAESALNQGKQQIAQITLAAGQLKSKQRTAIAKGGIDLSEGSAAEVQSTTDLMKAIDVDTAQQNALMAAFGYRVQEMNAQAQAASQRIDAVMARGSAASIDPAKAAFTSLLGGAANVAGSWYSMNQSGALSDTTPIFGGGNGRTMDTSMLSAPQQSRVTPTSFGPAMSSSSTTGIAQELGITNQGIWNF